MAWFGGYDPDFIRKFEGYSQLSDAQIASQIVWLPLTSSYYWQVEMRSVDVQLNQDFLHQINGQQQLY